MHSKNSLSLSRCRVHSGRRRSWFSTGVYPFLRGIYLISSYLPLHSHATEFTSSYISSPYMFALVSPFLLFLKFFQWASNRLATLFSLHVQKIQGTRRMGRPRQTYMESLCNWGRTQLPENLVASMTVLNILSATKDRNQWRLMIAYVLNGHGT